MYTKDLSCSISIHLARPELDFIRDVASAQGVTVSWFMRMALLSACATPTPYDSRFDTEHLAVADTVFSFRVWPELSVMVSRVASSRCVSLSHFCRFAILSRSRFTAFEV